MLVVLVIDDIKFPFHRISLEAGFVKDTVLDLFGDGVVGDDGDGRMFGIFFCPFDGLKHRRSIGDFAEDVKIFTAYPQLLEHFLQYFARLTPLFSADPFEFVEILRTQNLGQRNIAEDNQLIFSPFADHKIVVDNRGFDKPEIDLAFADHLGDFPAHLDGELDVIVDHLTECVETLPG